jgi:hypothetical protein
MTDKEQVLYSWLLENNLLMLAEMFVERIKANEAARIQRIKDLLNIRWIGGLATKSTAHPR